MLNGLRAPVPPGALDLTGDAVRRRRALQRAMMGVLDAHRYEEAFPPSFEYEETFLAAGGPGTGERLIRFLDRDGRVLALRYDFTASIARLAATTFAAAPRPLRVAYTGKVYRQEPERGGRPRELLQVGAELIGDASLAADVEIVRLTLALARAAGLGEFQLNVGHIGVLAPGLAALEPGLRARVRRWIDRKDRESLGRALAEAPAAADALRTLPFVIGRRAAIEAARATAPAAAQPGLDRLLALDDALDAAERAHVVYDLGEVRGLEYYTGLHFELFVAGQGRGVGGGGRYDDLVGRYGAPAAAVGFALELDGIAEVAP